MSVMDFKPPDPEMVERIRAGLPKGTVVELVDGNPVDRARVLLAWAEAPGPKVSHVHIAVSDLRALLELLEFEP